MILSALNDYYQRLAAQDKVPVQGYSYELISYELLINRDGELLQVNDLRRKEGKKLVSTSLQLPQSFKRPGTTPKSFFLWDKTAFILGVKRNKQADENESSVQLAEREHQAFRELHRKYLNDAKDARLRAVSAFLGNWKPSDFAEPEFTEEMLDANFVFRLEGEHQFIHECEEAKRIQSSLMVSVSAVEGRCLVSGIAGPLARLHPSIKNVNGAQSMGASIVSFNQSSFESYGKSQGDNSPVSETVAFAYTTALNYLLRRDSDNHQRLQIGDASVVFWAEASDAAHAEAAEGFFAMLNEPPSDEQEAARLKTLLDGIAQGRPLASFDPALEDDTRFFVLGLAPNAARLSIRFWCVNRLDQLARHYAAHHRDLLLGPVPWKGPGPAMWRLLYATAPSRDGKAKAEDISPQLAGELARAILTGSRYPRSLLTNVIMRLRNDGDISGIRVALCKAVLAREARLAAHSNSRTQEVPVSLDRHSTHPGYLLGRLFAELESAQRGALGDQVNATIRDRYYSAASATPASVFPMLLRNAQNHLSNMRKKDKGGLAHRIEQEIGTIIDGLGDTFPRSLRIEEQGRFAIGYYHQSQARFAKRSNVTVQEESTQGEDA